MIFSFDPSFLHELAIIQAGGGGSFGGGGGSGGGSGGDGDGFGWLIYLLLRLAIQHPVIGIPLMIGVAALGIFGSRKGWWAHQGRTIRRQAPARRERASAVSANSLRKDDPGFDEQRFLERVKIAFRKAQSAWCAQELEPLRPFVTDGVFERFSLQIEEQRGDGWRQELDGLDIGNPTIARVETGLHFDTLTVRIPFRCEVHRIKLSDGKRIKGAQLPKASFIEMWSFLRRRGTQTLSGDGLIEGKCPNCGAPLSMKQSAKCDSCACLASSGQFDWVLAEITQASVWSAEHERDIPGLTSYGKTDPGMSVQALEDRASVAFWRKCASDRSGKIDPLTSIGDPGFIEHRAEQLAERHSYHVDSAVGSVRTLGLLPGAERDRAILEVLWDGRRATLAKNGSVEVSERRQLHHTLLIFTRDADAQTNLDEAFATMHCRTCGAHDEGGLEAECAYCGAPRRGDRSAWLLLDVLNRSTPQARELLAELRGADAGTKASRPSPAQASTVELLEWAVALVRSDGVVDEEERRAVHSLASREYTSPELVDALLDADQEPALTLDGIAPNAGREHLSALIHLAYADGKIDAAEKRFLGQAAKTLGLASADLNLVINKARANLYQDSRGKH